MFDRPFSIENHVRGIVHITEREQLARDRDRRPTRAKPDGVFTLHGENGRIATFTVQGDTATILITGGNTHGKAYTTDRGTAQNHWRRLVKAGYEAF